jgi:hypothetical protein
VLTLRRLTQFLERGGKRREVEEEEEGGKERRGEGEDKDREAKECKFLLFSITILSFTTQACVDTRPHAQSALHYFVSHIIIIKRQTSSCDENPIILLATPLACSGRGTLILQCYQVS